MTCGSIPELEAAGAAPGGRDAETTRPAARAALDVTQLLLELSAAQREQRAKLVEAVVPLPQELGDLLTARSRGRSAGVARSRVPHRSSLSRASG